jgi:hypothetical protein
LGISNFGISNALAEGLLVFILDAVVVVASAMTRSLISLSLGGCLTGGEIFLGFGIAARCALPIFVHSGPQPSACKAMALEPGIAVSRSLK